MPGPPAIGTVQMAGLGEASATQTDFGRKHFGDEGSAREELVAELGAAFLCADLELTPEVRDDHASYIASWLEVLKSDKRCVVQAASYGQKAADYLHGLQPSAQPASAEARAAAAA
jgi:antirestriction protein ArdC